MNKFLSSEGVMTASALLLLLVPFTANAAGVDFTSAIAAGQTTSENLIASIPNFRGIAFAIAAVIGFFIFGSSLKRFYDLAGNPGHQQGLTYGTVITGVVVGVALMELGWSMTVMTETIFDTNFSWVKETNPGAASNVSAGYSLALATFMWMQLIGVAMTIKGIIMFTAIGKDQSASWGAALSHTLGGVVLSNIVVVTGAFSTFTGFNNPLIALGVAGV